MLARNNTGSIFVEDVGEFLTANNIRATVLGRISTKVDDKKFKIKYEDKFYKIVDKSFVRNKTVFFLEMIQDD